MVDTSILKLVFASKLFRNYFLTLQLLSQSPLTPIILVTIYTIISLILLAKHLTPSELLHHVPANYPRPIKRSPFNWRPNPAIVTAHNSKKPTAKLYNPQKNSPGQVRQVQKLVKSRRARARARTLFPFRYATMWGTDVKVTTVVFEVCLMGQVKIRGRSACLQNAMNSRDDFCESRRMT